MKNLFVSVIAFSASLTLLSATSNAGSSATINCQVHDSRGIESNTSPVTLDASGSGDVDQELAGSVPALRVRASAYKNRLVSVLLTTGSAPNEKGAVADVGVFDQTNLSGINLRTVESSGYSAAIVCVISAN